MSRLALVKLGNVLSRFLCTLFGYRINSDASWGGELDGVFSTVLHHASKNRTSNIQIIIGVFFIHIVKLGIVVLHIDSGSMGGGGYCCCSLGLALSWRVVVFQL